MKLILIVKLSILAIALLVLGIFIVSNMDFRPVQTIDNHSPLAPFAYEPSVKDKYEFYLIEQDLIKEQMNTIPKDFKKKYGTTDISKILKGEY